MKNQAQELDVFSSSAALEVLAPTHDLSTIRAAAAGGAHAVYFGVDKLSMRKDMASFTSETLPHAVELCHDLDLRAYLATNTVVYDSEMRDLHQILTNAKQASIDAVIVQDLAAMILASELEIDFHISTQCNVSNSLSASFYAQFGASRLVLARELSLGQVRNIAASTDAEIEVFVHGAMCFAYSGRCNFSQFFNHRLDNRGTCSQPCRRSWRLVDSNNTDFVYDEGHFFSAKDLCYLPYLPDLVRAGATVFKIEGRRRPPEYVEITSRCYSQALESVAAGEFTPTRIEDWMQQLRTVSNRGFSSGFLYGVLGPEASTLTIPSDRATNRRKLVGRVQGYDDHRGIVQVSLTKAELEAGDQLIIEGSDTYCRFRADSIQVGGVDFQRASVGALVDLPCDEAAETGAKVYAWCPKGPDTS